MNQYELAMMYKSHDIRDYIYSKRAIVLSRLDIYYKWPVITYHAKQNGDITGFYNPTVAATADGIYDLRLIQNQCVSKELFERMLGLDPSYIYYFNISDI